MTPEEIASLKAKHKTKLTLVEVKDGDDTYTAIVKDPDFKVLRVVEDMNKAGNEFGALNSMYDNCVVHADEEIANSDLYKSKVVEAISHRMASVKSSAKNL